MFLKVHERFLSHKIEQTKAKDCNCCLVLARYPKHIISKWGTQTSVFREKKSLEESTWPFLLGNKSIPFCFPKMVFVWNLFFVSGVSPCFFACTLPKSPLPVLRPGDMCSLCEISWSSKRRREEHPGQVPLGLLKWAHEIFINISLHRCCSQAERPSAREANFWKILTRYTHSIFVLPSPPLLFLLLLCHPHWNMCCVHALYISVCA